MRIKGNFVRFEFGSFSTIPALFATAEGELPARNRANCNESWGHLAFCEVTTSEIQAGKTG